MKAIGVIPARYASTRFPGKVLAELGGKPLIQHVWEKAKQCRRLDAVLVACDDERVLAAARGFGAEAVMTSAEHTSGSDRIAEAVSEREAGVVVNIQGDEPLIHPQVIDSLIDALENDGEAVVATSVKRINDQADLTNPNVVKVVIDAGGCALYFSRSCIPYNREQAPLTRLTYYKHLGIYAFVRDFLLQFTSMPKSYLEQTEKLEQLRILEAGYRIMTVETEHETVGVDTPEDLRRIAQQFGATP